MKVPLPIDLVPNADQPEAYWYQRGYYDARGETMKTFHVLTEHWNGKSKQDVQTTWAVYADAMTYEGTKGGYEQLKFWSVSPIGRTLIAAFSDFKCAWEAGVVDKITEEFTEEASDDGAVEPAATT